MLACYLIQDISIDTYKKEILPTCMLEDDVYLFFPLNLLKAEGKDNIQYHLSTRKTPLHDKISYNRYC